MVQNSHTLYVCTTCDKDPQKRETPAAADGKALYKKLKALLPQSPLAKHFTVAPVACIGSCERACSIALTASHKQACLFVGQDITRADDIMRLAHVYYNTPKGEVKYSMLSPRFKEEDSFLCRIPAPKLVG